MSYRHRTIMAALLLACPAARATYSIVACDATTRACGVAVQTNNLAVGASVPYARAGVGAIASQFETNPAYGPQGLALLASGKTAEETMKQLLLDDGNFDGQGPEARQVGVVSIDGGAFAYTGEKAASSPWAGSRTGNGFSIQGNGLAGAQVVEAMERAFLNTTGALAERLMAALSAGDHAGGQTTGRESAALLVRTTSGFPLDIDLRVDHSADPVADLRVLLNIQSARQQIVEARIAAGKGQVTEARALLISGVSLAPMWPRTWTQAARIAESIDEPELASQYLNIVFTMNPAWASSEIGSGNHAQLGSDPLFHRWVTTEEIDAANASYRQLNSAKDASAEDKVRSARRLLEVGEPKEGLVLLVSLPGTSSETPDIELLRATAYAALGRYAEAVEQCASAAAGGSGNTRLHQSCAKWVAEVHPTNIAP